LNKYYKKYFNIILFMPCDAFKIDKSKIQKNKMKCSVIKKIPPEIFGHFFSNGWEFLVQILRAY